MYNKLSRITNGDNSTVASGAVDFSTLFKLSNDDITKAMSNNTYASNITLMINVDKDTKLNWLVTCLQQILGIYDVLPYKSSTIKREIYYDSGSINYSSKYFDCSNGKGEGTYTIILDAITDAKKISLFNLLKYMLYYQEYHTLAKYFTVSATQKNGKCLFMHNMDEFKDIRKLISKESFKTGVNSYDLLDKYLLERFIGINVNIEKRLKEIRRI